MTDVVLFRELPTACGRRFGVATLNAAPALNALSLEMVRRLLPQLRAWAADPEVVGVALEGAGDKAFCAGGDIRALYDSIRRCGSAPNPYAQAFFAEEYQLDHLIHRYPKPVLCWGHGIVMGGGIGLLAGASHRVVTPASRLAMPEIGIGLFPDVGGSWFLRRMPGRTGLFLALTGAPLRAADALFAGLADFFLPNEAHAAVLDAVGRFPWPADPAEHHRHLSHLLADGACRTFGCEGEKELKRGQLREDLRHVAGLHNESPNENGPFSAPLQPAHRTSDRLPGAVAPPESALLRHFEQINTLIGHDDLSDIAARLTALETTDDWLQKAAAGFRCGSPTSAALTFRLWQVAKPLSLAEVFRLEYQAALGCCAHHDFAEGIRALLIDKDKSPRWQPARLEDVTPALIDDHLVARYAGPHPLAELGAAPTPTGSQSLLPA